MKAVGLYQYLPIANSDSLQDLDLPQPTANGHDLLVQVKAISVNPVDTKIRAPKDKTESVPKVLGWDAAGVVVAVGEKVTAFHPGDEVWYAGDITRPGSNSEFQLVDERIVGRKPQKLDFATAAAMPLTAITAWESLFERLGIRRNSEDTGKSILIIGGAGGVGSIAIQLSKRLAKLNVIATASRSETEAWCKQLGADLVVNHHSNLVQEVARAGHRYVDYVLCLNNTDHHWPAITEVIKPQGMICTIVGNQGALDMNELKNKSAGLVWEFMFTRAKYQTDDMVKQRELLNEVSQLIDGNVLQTTCKDVVRPINAANLRTVHSRIEQGNTIGKIVLADWN